MRLGENERRDHRAKTWRGSFSCLAFSTQEQCPALIEAYLTRTGVTDQSIDHLRQLPNLTSLRLWGTRVTDAAVDDLLEMNRLREIFLNDTAVTREGLARLKAGLAEATIHP